MAKRRPDDVQVTRHDSLGNDARRDRYAKFNSDVADLVRYASDRGLKDPAEIMGAIQEARKGSNPLAGAQAAAKDSEDFNQLISTILPELERLGVKSPEEVVRAIRESVDLEFEDDPESKPVDPLQAVTDAAAKRQKANEEFSSFASEVGGEAFRAGMKPDQAAKLGKSKAAKLGSNGGGLS